MMPHIACISPDQMLFQEKVENLSVNLDESNSQISSLQAKLQKSHEGLPHFSLKEQRPWFSIFQKTLLWLKLRLLLLNYLEHLWTTVRFIGCFHFPQIIL